jgi:hypoxanthine phosphoribosyltransferase
VTLGPGPAEVLVDARSVAARIRELGAEISRDFEGRNPVLVCILRGGFIFLTDLSRALTIPHEIDFLQVSRYDPKEKDPTGVKLLADLRSNVKGRHVIVVEGIRTRSTKMSYVDRFLALHEPASRTYAALLAHADARENPIPLHYCGFRIDNQFVVGMGLDERERFRNLPYIAAIQWEPRGGATAAD